MSSSFEIPDLTFSSVIFGKYETPWDLRVLLYFGGASANVRTVISRIARGELKNPLRDRLELVVKLHEALDGQLVGGKSTYSVGNKIRGLREIFSWAESVGAPLTMEAIERTYLAWADSLVHRQRIVRDLSGCSAYVKGSWVAEILDVALDRDAPLICCTRLKKGKGEKRSLTPLAEKKSLSESISFGHLLQDVCDALPVSVVLHGSLPIKIPLRQGGEIEQWSAFSKGHSGIIDRTTRHFLAWQGDGTLRTRSPLANLRLEAELLMFIGQTGMNLSQAQNLKIRQFFYISNTDGYQVKDRKNRRGGDVIFEIFKDYKPHFDRFLAWRRTLFPESDLVFPFVNNSRRDDKIRDFRLRSICRKIGLKFFSPRDLRFVRINWILRRSGDPDMTSSMAQHSKETLLRDYHRPSQQRAMSEVMRFWKKFDPHLSSIPISPGKCVGQPIKNKYSAASDPDPDCLRASGCLWCENHRDTDNLDYVWAMASFRHLKIIENSKWHAPQNNNEVHPAKPVIDRISEKLSWFCESSSRRKKWVEEALARIEEGIYHPDWRRVIQASEGEQ